MPFFPIALNVKERRCVVVGGGNVGARKALALLEAEAQVVIVSPTVCQNLQNEIDRDRIEWIAEPFHPDHLNGAFLCIAATPIAEINGQVALAARERNILFNLAGQTDVGDNEREVGDFVTMASIQRNHLLLAVTTGGAGPALSARLRREWETEFGPEWSVYTELLRLMRIEAKNRIPDETTRTTALRRLVAQPTILAALANGDWETAKREADKCLFG